MQRTKKSIEIAFTGKSFYFKCIYSVILYEFMLFEILPVRYKLKRYRYISFTNRHNN